VPSRAGGKALAIKPVVCVVHSASAEGFRGRGTAEEQIEELLNRVGDVEAAVVEKLS